MAGCQIALTATAHSTWYNIEPWWPTAVVEGTVEIPLFLRARKKEPCVEGTADGVASQGVRAPSGTAVDLDQLRAHGSR
jgi:hypothetical protein